MEKKENKNVQGSLSKSTTTTTTTKKEMLNFGRTKTNDDCIYFNFVAFFIELLMCVCKIG